LINSLYNTKYATPLREYAKKLDLEQPTRLVYEEFDKIILFKNSSFSEKYNQMSLEGKHTKALLLVKLLHNHNLETNLESEIKRVEEMKSTEEKWLDPKKRTNAVDELCRKVLKYRRNPTVQDFKNYSMRELIKFYNDDVEFALIETYGINTCVIDYSWADEEVIQNPYFKFRKIAEKVNKLKKE
jgi:hypothetical protein